MLDRLIAIDNDIRIAIIGIGSIGKGLFYQSHITPGIRCVGIADIRPERAIACAEWLGYDYRACGTLDEVHDAVARGRLAICEDGDLLARCDMTDILLESSSSVPAGGRFSETAIRHGKHVILMNAEADLIFGPYLLQLAREKGVVYTSCDGDQPVSIARLVEDVRLWGFELVMAGNIKGFLDRYANPTSIIPEADKRYLDYQQCSAYTDGTKLCIEQALVANAMGLATAVPGMHGPRAAHVREVPALFDLRGMWERHGPVVDYVLGAEPKGGVFAVGYSDDDYQRRMLAWFPSLLGEGPFYVFYVPYHLCHVEAMKTVADVALDRRPLLQPTHGFRTNVYAYAKRGLRAGERLDGIGGYACYGLIENCGGNGDNPGLPICLADDVVLTRDIGKDEKILLSDVRYDSARADFAMYGKALQASAKGAVR